MQLGQAGTSVLLLPLVQSIVYGYSTWLVLVCDSNAVSSAVYKHDAGKAKLCPGGAVTGAHTNPQSNIEQYCSHALSCPGLCLCCSHCAVSQLASQFQMVTCQLLSKFVHSS